MAKQVIILASGGGSNAECIITHLHQYTAHRVVAILTNKSKAGVLDRAKRLNIPSHHIAAKDMDKYILDHYADVDGVILAGYLRKISSELVQHFPRKIINVHPSLLPKFGGKGMYGHHVHQAVFDAQETQSGMTIHYVNAEYDKGSIIMQARTDISQCSSADEIAANVLRLEHFHYPRVIGQWLDGELLI